MAKYRKKPVVIEATKWFKNGDHPEDFPKLMHDKEGREFDGEGEVVRRYCHTHPNEICKSCDRPMKAHGWVDTLEGGHVVCPGDYIITGLQGECYPCKPDIFEKTYEKVENDE